MPGERRSARLDWVARHRQTDLTVVVENIHDPHNVSAILRSCDAAGVLQVQLLYTKEDLPAIGKKSSASASKWVKRRSFSGLKECYATLRKEGYAIYATRLGSNSQSLYDLDLTKKVALIFGNEHRGVSDDAAEQADINFQIPMFGMIQSLNVSVASAVALFEAVRQRLAKGEMKNPRVSEQELKRLLSEWKTK